MPYHHLNFWKSKEKTSFKNNHFNALETDFKCNEFKWTKGGVVRT